MKWTTKEPQSYGWYWVLYYDYEFPEVVYHLPSGTYTPGQKERVKRSQIRLWSDSHIELPEKG